MKITLIIIAIIIFSVLNSAFRDNRVVKLPGPAINGNARGKTELLAKSDRLGGDPGRGQLCVAAEGEAGHKEDEVTNGLARFWLTILKVLKKKKF